MSKIKELESEFDVWDNIYQKEWDNDTGEGMEGYNALMARTETVRNKMSDIRHKINLLEPIKWDGWDGGDLMTIEEWKECVEGGGFIDYDGSGNYATKDKVSNKSVSPSDVEAGRFRTDVEFTHIMWYNK
ncbi:unnamed protein product [marine sediment metagenome]|uniref:Uncharacterized protein n=1 Tax=marine sediment metagenome TaxID=412755 RepID=X0TD81_9ZZZZ